MHNRTITVIMHEGAKETVGSARLKAKREVLEKTLQLCKEIGDEDRIKIYQQKLFLCLQEEEQELLALI